MVCFGSELPGGSILPDSPAEEQDPDSTISFRKRKTKSSWQGQPLAMNSPPFYPSLGFTVHLPTTHHPAPPEGPWDGSSRSGTPTLAARCLCLELKISLSAHDELTMEACFPITRHLICLPQSNATLQISRRYGNQGIKTFPVQ